MPAGPTARPDRPLRARPVHALAAALLFLAIQGCGPAAPESAAPGTGPSRAVVQEAAADSDPPDEVAVGFFTAWSRRDLAPGPWWQQLAPRLNARGRQDFTGTDPAEIPPLRITGRAQQTSIENDVYAEVRIPTNRGAFTVRLSRHEAGTWRVGALTFPHSPTLGGDL